jgi:hypothetical protein
MSKAASMRTIVIPFRKQMKTEIERGYRRLKKVHEK